MSWGMSRRFRLWMQGLRSYDEAMLPRDGGALPLLQREAPEAALQAAAIFRGLGSPVWYGGQAQWLSGGAAVFSAMLEDIRRAEKAVWLEYDRFPPGVMSETILMALRQAAVRGVEVRLIYNRFLPGHSPRELARMHIQALPLAFPLRTHRQMAVMDSAIAYVGGVGMSDGQIGVDHRRKPQRDGAMRVEGCAVRAFSAAFASLWESVSGQAPELPPEREHTECSYGYMQPFWDAVPSFSAMVGMIAGAQSELWLMLPGLRNAALYRALLRAAQSGVQVHLLLSGKGLGIPRLLRAGAKVYPFPSGAFHARLLCADQQLVLLDTGKRGLLPCLGSGLWLYGKEAAAPIPAALRRMIAAEKRISKV